MDMNETLNTNTNQLMRIIQKLSVCILESGGETSRAEETVLLLCRKFETENVDVLAIPTGVFVMVTDKTGQTHTIIVRVKKRSVDLMRLNLANTVSRMLTDGTITVTEAENLLNQPKKTVFWKKLLRIPIGALSTACFAVLYGGGFLEFCGAALCGAAIQTALLFFKSMDMFHFVSSFIGGLIAAVFAVFYIILLPYADLHLIIIGAIIPLLPGLALTNAIRDTINGDLVSGVSRFGEVLMVAVSIAAGVSVVLFGYMTTGGTL